MKLLENVSLKPYNTFGIDISAKYFSTFNTIEQLQAILENNDLNSLPRLILGGGSNMLFTKDFAGIVLLHKLIDENVDFPIILVFSNEVSVSEFLRHTLLFSYGTLRDSSNYSISNCIVYSMFSFSFADTSWNCIVCFLA